MKVLKVQRFRTMVPSGCTISSVQTAVYYLGHFIYQTDIAKIVNFNPLDGISIKEALTKLGKKIPIRHKFLASIKKIENWIDKGLPVCSGDDGRIGPHAVVIIGYDNNNFVIADPGLDHPRHVNKEALFNHSDEFYGVFKK